MSTINRSPNPALQRPDPMAGGVPSAPPLELPPALSQLRTPLADIFPEFATVAGGFTQLTLPSLTVAAGEAAWYPLIDQSIAELTSDECGLFAAYFDLLSCDVDAGGGAGAVGWGTSQGLGAAIVVGRELPLDPDGGWNVAPHSIPGFDSDTLTVANVTRYLMLEGFPPGKYDATTPIPRSQPRTLAPTAVRFDTTDRLQAAFVLNNAYANNNAGTLYGRVGVQLTVALKNATNIYMS